MSGDDVLFFLEEIWFDLMNLGQADVFSLLFRIMLVVFAAIILIGLMQFIFGSFFRLLGEILGSVRRAVSRLFFWRGPIRRMKARREQAKRDKEHREWQKRQEQQQALRQQQEAQEAIEKQKEQERVMKTLKDL